MRKRLGPVLPKISRYLEKSDRLMLLNQSGCLLDIPRLIPPQLYEPRLLPIGNHKCLFGSFCISSDLTSFREMIPSTSFGSVGNTAYATAGLLRSKTSVDARWLPRGSYAKLYRSIIETPAAPRVRNSGSATKHRTLI